MVADDEPTRPDKDIGGRAYHTGLSNEISVVLAIPGKSCPGGHKSKTLNYSEKPLALFYEEPHDGVKLDDRSVSVHPCGRYQIDDAN